MGRANCFGWCAALVSMLCLTSAGAEVIWLGHFNQSVNADYSTAAPEGTVAARPPSPPNTGPAITTDNSGNIFTGETVHEALDLGYNNPAREGRVTYAAPAADMSSGTIQFWVKTDFAWNKPNTKEPDGWDECHFINLPLAGGYIGNRISVYWINRGNRGILYFLIYDGVSQATAYLLPETAPERGINLAAGVWHYVACTWTPTQLRLFVDGKLAGEAAAKFSLLTTTGTMSLGAAAPVWPGDLPAHALMDEVRISNKALFAGLNEIPAPTASLDKVE